MYIKESKSESSNTRESANLVDILRFIASLLIIAYHSQIFFALSSNDQAILSPIKILMLSFAMPFFNTMVTFFANKTYYLNHHITILAKKLVKILSIIGIFYIFTVLSNIFTIYFYKQSFSELIFFQNTSFEIILREIRFVHNSSIYWLFDLIFLNIYTFVFISIYKKDKRAGIIYFIIFSILLIYISSLNTYLKEIFFINLDVGLVSYISGTLGFLILDYLHNKPILNVESSLISTLIVILTVLTIGIPNLIIYNYHYLNIDNFFTSIFAIALFMIFPLLSILKIPNNTVSSILSQYGRNYSLGIYLVHSLVYVITDIFIMYFTQKQSYAVNILVWLIRYLLTMLITVIVVKYTKKYIPFLVTI